MSYEAYVDNNISCSACQCWLMISNNTENLPQNFKLFKICILIFIFIYCTYV